MTSFRMGTRLSFAPISRARKNLAMLAAMRLASSRVGSTSPSRRHETIRLDQVHLPGNSELPLDQDARRSTPVTCTGVLTPPRAVAMPRALSARQSHAMMSHCSPLPSMTGSTLSAKRSAAARSAHFFCIRLVGRDAATLGFRPLRGAQGRGRLAEDAHMPPRGVGTRRFVSAAAMPRSDRPCCFRSHELAPVSLDTTLSNGTEKERA